MNSISTENRNAAKMRIGKRLKTIVSAVPITTWIIIFVMVPLIIVLQYSLYLKVGTDINKSVTSAANFLQFFTDPVYVPIFLKTIYFSLIIAGIGLGMGYPLAYFISRKLKRFRNQFYLLILVPLWVSYLVRIIAWQTILGRTGVINSILLSLGVIHQPIGWLIYSPFAVVITLVHITLPFVFIPIFNSLEKIPRNLINAASDLGANGFKTFIHVIFPLSIPGVLSGFTMAFVIALGDYIIPKQLGGTTMTMFGNLISDQFGLAYNWPLGSALGFILFIVAIAIIMLSTKIGKSGGYME